VGRPLFPPRPDQLTCAEGRLPGPAPVRPAGPVLGAPRQVEARLAGVDQRVAQRGQLDGTHIRLARELWLAAVVGWGGGGNGERGEKIQTVRLGTNREEVKRCVKCEEGGRLDRRRQGRQQGRRKGGLYDRLDLSGKQKKKEVPSKRN